MQCSMAGAVIPRNLANLGARILSSNSVSVKTRTKQMIVDPISLFHGGQRSYISRGNPISPVLEQSRCFLATSSQVHIFKVFQSTNSATPKGEGEVSNEAAAELSPEAKAAADEVAQLKESLVEIQAKHDEVLDKYRRSIAENDNMRKRLTKQIEDAKIFGIQSFCKDLLDVADVLNRAVSSNSGADTSNQAVLDMLQGLKLTENQLLQVFKRHGLEPINPLNEKFDPNKHEALFQIPNPDVDFNTVLDVQKIGYQLRGRTIRPALVGVSKK